MRIHRLAVTAFGPFAGTVEIDFEELNAAGVFLVTGPTGAGKSSILDAVCFALFGQVPGARGVKTLRSDHAPAMLRPEVVLDFTLGERRFEVRRSPEWRRPKRRGSGDEDGGMTTEKASASLMEKTGGSEGLVSSRAQEVGHFLSSLLGMTASQFQQVALLPQGEFQTFLRATSQERHDVLQQLFGTERFTRIEEWVSDHSRRLYDRALEGEVTVRRLVDTMADRAGVEPPEAFAGDGLARGASSGRVRDWAAELVAVADTVRRRAAQAHRDAADAVRRARSAHEEAVRLADAHARRASAQAVLSRLIADEDVRRARVRLAADRRAGQCLGLLELLDESQERHRCAVRHAAEAAAAVPGVVNVAQAAQRAAVELAEARALVPREQELRSLAETVAAHRRRLAELTPRLRQVRASLENLPPERDRIEADLAAARDRLNDRAAIQAEFETARLRAEAASGAVRAAAKLSRAEDAERRARDDYADARERMLTVVERRLQGMAAELAAQLGPGDACQVCGSVDHPALARHEGPRVDHAAQVAATSEAEALRVVHDAAQERVREAALEHAALAQAAGGLEPEHARRELERYRRALADLDHAERAAAEAERHLSGLDELAERLTAEHRELAQEVERLELLEETQSAEADRVASELRAAVGDHESVASAVAALTERVAALHLLLEAESAIEHAEADVRRHVEAATDAAARQGFDTLREVRAAILTSGDRTALTDELERHDRALHEARATLRDPALAGLPVEVPDPAGLAAALHAAVEAEAEAARDHHLSREVAETLGAQRGRLERALSGWAPARDEYLTAEAMARLVRGTAADNRLQMRLSSYVLATRLDQVVAAANERLAHMREQRYLLERTGAAARRGSPAGLGLRVVDEWTGEPRDPATLSGGETFVVSLALALGLSDVVSRESGGVRLDTLFIDEGFGMLDLDTLDDVMDRLDGLRAGGRTVGVVSHVTELRNRIPTQLHVDKQRHGSTVSVTTLIA